VEERRCWCIESLWLCSKDEYYVSEGDFMKVFQRHKKNESCVLVNSSNINARRLAHLMLEGPKNIKRITFNQKTGADKQSLIIKDKSK
jgi:hypothetical protein